MTSCHFSLSLSLKSRWRTRESFVSSLMQLWHQRWNKTTTTLIVFQLKSLRSSELTSNTIIRVSLQLLFRPTLFLTFFKPQQNSFKKYFKKVSLKSGLFQNLLISTMKNFNNGMRQRKTPWESFRWSIALGFLPPPVFTPMEGKERISYAYNKKITKTFCLPRFWRKIPNKCFRCLFNPNCALLFLLSWERERRTSQRRGKRRMNCLLINELHALQSLVFLSHSPHTHTHIYSLTYTLTSI